MNEQTANSASADSVSRQGDFHVLAPSRWRDGIGPGLQIANAQKLARAGMYTLDPPNGDPAQYAERPHLVHVPEEGGLPRDFDVFGSIWIVSQALKDVFESVDPQGFAFAACDFTLADGSAGPRYYLCNVTRSLDALDEQASRVKIRMEHDHLTGEDVKFYSVAGGATLAFKPRVVAGAHIFRQRHSGLDPVCDRVMVQALNRAPLDGVHLQDASAL
ncbi:MAG: imm11 family protein [Pseudomonadales bacterium]